MSRVTAVRSSWRRADVQGLRGVAVLLVVLYHSGVHVPGGFVGVDAFFVISGFVISGVLLRELEADGRIDFRGFYARRVRRLLPALATVVVVVAIVGVFVAPVDSQAIGAETGIAASFFIANGYLIHLASGYFDVTTAYDPLLHTWTLGVEEQFYIVFPALLFLAWRLFRRQPRVGASVAVGSVSAFSLVLMLELAGADRAEVQRFAFYGSPTRAWEFGAGALLAIVTPSLASVPSAVLRVLELGGLVALVASALLIHGAATFIGWQMLWPVAAALALIAAGSNLAAHQPRLLPARPLTWLGDLSYSWYLWHWPAIVFTNAVLLTSRAAPAAAAISLLPAWLSYRYVETPIRLGRRFSNRSLAIAAVCVTVPAAASLGLLAANHLLIRTTVVHEWQSGRQSYLSALNGCEESTPLGQRTGSRWTRCTWTVPHPQGRLLLLGTRTLPNSPSRS